MSKRPRVGPAEDGDALPTEGLEVEEVRDEGTEQLFMREWRKRVIREFEPRDAAADATEPVPASTAPH